MKTSNLSLCLLIMMIVISCGVKRENKVLVIYDDQLPDLTGAFQSTEIGIDTMHITSQRLGDDLLVYRGVVLAVDPGSISVQWQTDIERLVQSGGGLIAEATEVNQYQWPLLAKGNDSKILRLSNLSELNVDHISTIMKSGKVNVDAISSLAAPDENRFTKIVLDADVNEPMELAILPSGKVIYIEREGDFKLFNPETKQTKLLHRFEISTQGNYEDGMLGLAIDPNYALNQWVYIYYSPYGGHGRQNLSRFVLAYEDSLIVDSEKIVLEVPVQRETCCHSGGSINFGPDGNLFLSTGDNTSSKESDGYSPLDERPGRGPYDSQKSSGNANDLRGKILRITPTADGSYTIPDGNLFPKDGSKGKPEIYTMGCRNPFRFSVDQRTGYVYWGDVGPDSGKGSELGPQSYDEWNQARTPGNYGWPYFEADNKAYPMFDFETGVIGPKQDPNAPVNESPNNTGVRELPPARIPMIWYPYGDSEIWPMLGKGSRSAMSGPVYYQPYGQTGFPAYYEGKLFIYEWARSWIKVVSFDEDWNMIKIEEFMPNEEFVKPIDMEFDQYGNMYVLEYGANYFANNVDARLVKIEYADGNRKPIPAITTDATRGSVPLTVQFSASNSQDYDEGDVLTYAWSTGDQSQEGEVVSFTFEEMGAHTIELVVTDQDGSSAMASTQVIAGNGVPSIKVSSEQNLSFYFDNESINYKVSVEDKEDGSTEDGSIQDVQINFTYLDRTNDLALLGEDFFKNPVLNLKGKSLIDNSDCKSCHAMNETSIGPSYMQIGERYVDDVTAPSMLAQKILEGGNGNWGHSLMAAHPQHTEAEALEMVDYIMSLTQKGSAASLSLTGTVSLDQHEGDDLGTYVFSARYTDKGNGDISPIEQSAMFMIRNPVLEAEDYDFFNNVQQQRPRGGDLAFVDQIRDGSFIGFGQLDLTGISQVLLKGVIRAGGKVSVRIDSPDGKEIGSAEIAAFEGNWGDARPVELQVAIDASGVHDLYFVFSNAENQQVLVLDQVRFKN
ncbi:MAG: PQQ-dependent sugar dehydrogenase [Cyclobacteriaceae bacterium]